MGGDENVALRESKLEQFVREAKVVLTEHSREHLSRLPLVGLRHASHAYSLSFQIVELFQSVRRFMFSQITHFSQLPQDHIFIQAFVDTSVQQSHFGELFFMKDLELESEHRFGSQPHKSTDLPLIGLKRRNSRGISKFFEAVHKFTCSQAARTNPEHLSYTFEHVLGTDVKVDKDMHLQSKRWREGLSGEDVAPCRAEGEIAGLADEDMGLDMLPGSFKANGEFSVERFISTIGSLQLSASCHVTDSEPFVSGGGLMAFSVQLPSGVLLEGPHEDQAGSSLRSDDDPQEQHREGTCIVGLYSCSVHVLMCEGRKGGVHLNSLL